MARRLFTALSFLLLAVCVTTAAMWGIGLACPYCTWVDGYYLTIDHERLVIWTSRLASMNMSVVTIRTSLLEASYGVTCVLSGIGFLIFWLLKHWPETARSDCRCAACGYNLTGNTSGVCPECGTSTTC